MMPRPDELLTVPAIPFAPLPLCLDDALPVSMVLLMGYGHRLDPMALRTALGKALQAFPHMGGRLHLDFQPLEAALVPGESAVRLEWVRAAPGSLHALQSLDQETLFSRYAPSAAESARMPMGFLQAPLLQLRLSWLEEGDACVLGLMASHMALDGVGLALFLEHMVAAMRGGAAPGVSHDRRSTFAVAAPKDASLPAHYREVPQPSLAMAQGQDPAASSRPTVFSVPALPEDRIPLAAFLCQEVAALEPARRTVALWCNARGLGAPRDYTGNAGCYVHVPLAEDVGQGLRRAMTRRGFAEVAETFARLKTAEAAGRFPFWNGPGEELLSLNLVPHARNPADFGRGSPVYAQLLTRNVSGLRLFGTPDGARLVVEAALPESVGAGLVAACDRKGLDVQVWHRPRS